MPAVVAPSWSAPATISEGTSEKLRLLVRHSFSILWKRVGDDFFTIFHFAALISSCEELNDGVFVASTTFALWFPASKPKSKKGIADSLWIQALENMVKRFVGA